MREKYINLFVDITWYKQDVLTNSQEQGSYGADGEDDYGFDFWD